MTPYDSDSFEPSLVRTLEVLRERGLAPSPNEEMVEAAKSVSAPLAAFAHTLGAYLPGPEFGRFELDAEPAESEADQWQDDAQAEGVDPSNCLMIGNTGGGEQILFMAGTAGETGYALFLFAMDGEPYPASGSALWKVGTFAELFAHLRKDEREELDPRLTDIADG